jgi:NIMA (never in mitosis gene a)-related kinase
LALKIRDGVFERIPEEYSEELMRVIRWMLKPEQKSRPNVEDLLNLPNVSIRLRERALKRNI